MNIALFADSYKPYISGVAVSVETLSLALRKGGHTTYVFAPSYGGADAEDGVYRFPSIPAFYPGFRIALPFSLRIQRELLRLKIDIVHSHSPFQLGLLARRTARRLKVPFVFTLHTLFDQYLHYIPLLPLALSKNIMLGHLRRFCNSCDRIIVPSAFVKRVAEEQGVTAKIDVVPTGIDFDAVKDYTGEGVREKHGIPLSATLLLYVGRLSKEKNIPFLLNAMRIVFSQDPSARLLIAAGGPEKDRFSSLAKSLGIGEKVTFAGEVRRPEVFNYYAAADIFVFASTTETQGLVLAEAAGMGLPVVAVDAAGISGAIVNGEEGFLVKEDPGLFADRALLLVKDASARACMGRAARSWAFKNFSAEAYANRVEKVYREVLY